MSSFNVGDRVVIQQGSSLRNFDGLECRVLPNDEYNEKAGRTYLHPLNRRPDTGDHCDFWWTSEELILVGTDELVTLSKEIDRLRGRGYTVKVSVTAPAPKAVVL